MVPGISDLGVEIVDRLQGVQLEPRECDSAGNFSPAAELEDCNGSGDAGDQGEQGANALDIEAFMPEDEFFTLSKPPRMCSGDPQQSTRSPVESLAVSALENHRSTDTLPVKPQEDEASTGHSRPTLRLHSISTGARQRKSDSFRHLSAIRSDGHASQHGGANLPLLLTGFVCAIAAMCGLVVTGVHYCVLYSGCPLGVNGCNEFQRKEAKGFFLIRWISGITDGYVPEDAVYILVALLGALAYCAVVTRLPVSSAFEIKGGGALQSLVAVATGERILLRDAVLRILMTSLYLGSGGSLGGEGPAIQVCTSFSMAVGWACGIGSSVTQSLLASLGFACGFAASFNAPVAGILFAMEELEHVSPSLEKSMICCILMASIVATATMRFCHGDTQIFKVHWAVQDAGFGFGHDLWMLIAIPIGLLCSVIGAAVVLGLRWLNKLRIRYVKCYYTVLFTCQAVIVALVGMAVFRATGLRGVWGIGVGSLQYILDNGNQLEVWDFLIFAFGKGVAMVLAVAVRAPGDVLEPVLIIGGFVGGAVGRALCYGLEMPSDEVMTPCIVFGMVGLFASCFRFPLTPIVIVGELTGIQSYSVILPTALAGFTAMTASSRLFRPILDEIMHEDGIDLQALMEEVANADAAIPERQGPVDEESNDAVNESVDGVGAASFPDGRRNSYSLWGMEELLKGLAETHSVARGGTTSHSPLRSCAHRTSCDELSRHSVDEASEDLSADEEAGLGPDTQPTFRRTASMAESSASNRSMGQKKARRNDRRSSFASASNLVGSFTRQSSKEVTLFSV